MIGGPVGAEHEGEGGVAVRTGADGIGEAAQHRAPMRSEIMREWLKDCRQGIANDCQFGWCFWCLARGFYA